MTDEPFIREPNRVSGPLTPEEEKGLRAVADEWIAITRRVDTTDRAVAADAIKRLYKACDLPEPAVAFAISPALGVHAYGAAATWWANEGGKDEMPHPTPEEYSLGHTVRDVAQQCIRPGVTLAAPTDDPDPDVWMRYRQECAAIAGPRNTWDRNAWASSFQGGNMWAAVEAFIAGSRDVLGLDLPEYKKYQPWEDAARNSSCRFLHEKFCIVCEFPEYLGYDEENRPHGDMRASHRWRDGWELFYWHGVRIPAEWIKTPEVLTAQMAITWAQIEQRRAAMEILGWDKILLELNAKSIDNDNDPEVGELLECEIPDVGREKFLRVQCGTGRIFALPVPPDMRTALQAQAWTWGHDGNDFVMPDIRT